jgi:hypothetical protein
VRRLVPLLAALLFGCRSQPRGTAADRAYALGRADEVRRLYWAKQALEAPGRTGPAGRTEYYVWEESGTAADGRKLAPEKVAVPVFIPAPLPSGEASR